MAQEYVIRIKDETSQSSAAPVATQTDGGDQQGQPKQKVNPNVASYIASKSISPMVKAITSHVTASVGIETGSRELQQKTDFAMQLVGTGMNTWSNVAAAASIFGPAGIAVGLFTTAVGLLTQIGIKQSQLNQQRMLEDEQLALYRSRFGLAFNGSRTGGAV